MKLTDADVEKGLRARGPGHAAIAALLCLWASSGAAQTPPAPNTVTPRTLRPPPTADEPSIVLPSTTGLAPPAGSETLIVTPGRIIVEGTLPEVADEVAKLARSIEGRSVTLASIYNLASAIESVHARQGYILARAAVPPQQIEPGGTVRIVIIDGFIEQVDTSLVPRRVRATVAARLSGLVRRNGLRLAEIERQLLLAGQVAGVTLRSTLSRGDEPGGVKLILGARWDPVRAMVRADNAIDRTLADANLSLQLSLNSVLGVGETIYGYLASSDPIKPIAPSTRVRVFGGGVLLAVGDGRLTINSEATVSRTRPEIPLGAPETMGRLERYSLRTNYVVEQTREGYAALSASLEAVDQRNRALAFDVDIARDSYAAVRFGGSMARRAWWGSWNADAQFSRGLGALSSNLDLPPTRQGASTQFSRVTAQLRTVVPLNSRTALNGFLYAQSSFGEPMLRAEQFQLEGNEAVSAYVGGATAVDEGVTSRIEASYRLTLPRVAPSIYTFAAAGYGAINQPTTLESDSLGALAIGGGIRLSLLDGRGQIGLEYAYGVATRDYLDARQRVNASIALRF